MTHRTCDIVIAGARCAGASLATLLARQGQSVIVVDKDRLPSDQVISTHTIHPPGMDVLDELGVGDAVRAGSPASPRMRLMKNDTAVDLSFREGRADYCPRRERLDGLLQQAAANAGAEVIDRCRITALLTDARGRVTGVRATRDGEEISVNARLVVGADGRHSTIAKLVGADEYLAYDAPRGTYWGYWYAPPVWRSDRYPFDLFVANRFGDVRVIFQTDDNRLLIGTALPVERIKQWRSNPLEHLTRDLMSDPVTAPLIEGRAPVEPVRGTISERYFFRAAAGPGWVLAGDAGHHKDFVAGDGITEALLQVRSLAPAILEGSDLALQRWWRERDVEALPMYWFAMDEGRSGPPSVLQEVVFANVASDAALRQRMVRTVEHDLAPSDVFAASTIARWTLGAALKGRVGAIGDFLRTGKLMGERQKELATRRELATRARAAAGA